jgi:putative ABC transport system permease protein
MTVVDPPRTSSTTETAAPTSVAPSRLRLGDVLSAGIGSMTRRGARSVLSALGVSIGIAALVAVLGLSESSRAELNDQLSALGTNLLVVTPGSGFGTSTATLDPVAADRINHIGAVKQASAVTTLDIAMTRNRWMSTNDTRGLGVVGADSSLLNALSATIANGRWPAPAWNHAPVGVMGAEAAQKLGITDLSAGPTVRVGTRDITIVGILDPVTLAPDLDSALLVSRPIADEIAGSELTPGALYVRTTESAVDAVRGLLPATVSPLSPEEVQVTRPSDALSAKASAESTFTALFVGLGAVALLVGGIGIANVMIISVIERRTEIGLRRALGARRAHIRRQFLSESVALGLAGGIAGVLFGCVATVIFAKVQGWRVVIPPSAVVVGLGGAVIIGAIAGLYPAVRAARLSPTDALRGV